MAWDMFGVLLHRLRAYQIIMHLVTMTFSIQAIQLYRTVRFSAFRNSPLIPVTPELGGQGHDFDNKSDILLRSAGQKKVGASERSKTVGSGGGLKSSSARPSAINFIREKTMELRLKKQEDSTIF